MIQFEEDEDFFNSMIAEAEMEAQLEEPEVEEEEYDEETTSLPPPPSKQPIVVLSTDDEEMSSTIDRAAVKQGKRPEVIDPEEEEEFGFGEEEFEPSRTSYPPAKPSLIRLTSQLLYIEMIYSVAAAKSRHAHSYTAQYSDLTNLNLNLVRPGYIEAAPISAKNFDGRVITLRRRKRIDAYDESPGEVVCSLSFRSPPRSCSILMQGCDCYAQRKAAQSMTKLSSEMLERPYQTMLRDIKDDAYLKRKQDDADACVVYFTPFLLILTS